MTRALHGNMLTVEELASNSLADMDAIKVEHARSTARGEAVYMELALALNLAMISDEVAQHRYREIYGCDWTPVPPLVDGDAASSQAIDVSPDALVGTVASTPHARSRR
jgi:hypothetical protein